MTGKSRIRSAAAPALLALGAVLAYANAFAVPFLFDDIPALLENPAFRATGAAAGSVANGGVTLSGRPVLAASFRLNHALGGFAVAGYHGLNLLVHLGAGLVLWGLLRRTLARCASVAAAAEPVALAAAFFWMVHPLQTEAVTYVVQRAESLAGFFYLLTLYAFARGVDAAERGRRWFALSVTACALGMATKETVVTAPVVVWFYDRTFGAGTFRGALRARPRFYAALAATWLLLLGLVAVTGGNRGGTVGFGVGVAPWTYAATQFEAIARYIGLGLWPHPLVFEYGTFWVRDAADVLPFAVPIVLLLGATVLALWRWPKAGFAGAWFFGILAPTSLTPGTIQMIVEHRAYLSLAALVTLAVVLLHAALGRWARWAAVAAGASLVTLALARNRDYRSELALWGKTVAQRPHNAIALTNLGLAEFHAGRPAEAAALYRRALRENPHHVEALYNLGIAEEKLGQPADAIALYEAALRERPGLIGARSNLAHALLASGQTAAAVTHYRDVVRLEPKSPDAHANLGRALLQADRAAEAVGEFESARQLAPDRAETHYDLGNALAQLGRMADATAEFEAAVRLRPDYADAQVNLGNALLQLDRVPDAMAHYEAALRQNPALPDAHNNLGLVLLRLGRTAEAVAHFRAALAARPDFAEARQNLAAAEALAPK